MTKTVSRWARSLRDGIVAPVATWYRRQRMIEELNGLSDRVLADIGLTRSDIPAAVKGAFRPAPFMPAETVALGTAAAAERPAASNDETRPSLAA